jgi:hypothetical protein
LIFGRNILLELSGLVQACNGIDLAFYSLLSTTGNREITGVD